MAAGALVAAVAVTVGVALALLLGVALASWMRGRAARSLFEPQREGMLDEAWGGGVEHAWIPSDGGTLHAVVVPPPGSARPGAPAVLFSHGNSGSVWRYHHFLRAAAARLGATVAAYDSRGFGLSSGDGAWDTHWVADARAAAAWARRRWPGRLLVAWGESMGGAAAAAQAAEGLVDGLVLQVTFARVGDAAPAPLRPLLDRATSDPLDSAARLAAAPARPPALVIAVRDDPVVPNASTRDLAAAMAAAGYPVETLTVPGAHARPDLDGGGAWEAAARLLRRAAATSRPQAAASRAENAVLG